MNISKNIVLMGFMGSGKSSLAKLLRERYGVEVYSTDELIEARHHLSVREIFTQHGEGYFRQCEEAVVKSLSAKQGVVIDCGGGVVLNPANITQLKSNGIIFFLNASANVIFDRLKNVDNRPLLNTPDPMATIKQLLEQRLPLYLAAADHVLDANDPSLEPALNQILKIIQ